MTWRLYLPLLSDQTGSVFSRRVSGFHPQCWWTWNVACFLSRLFHLSIASRGQRLTRTNCRLVYLRSSFSIPSSVAPFNSRKCRRTWSCSRLGSGCVRSLAVLRFQSDRVFGSTGRRAEGVSESGDLGLTPFKLFFPSLLYEQWRILKTCRPGSTSHMGFVEFSRGTLVRGTFNVRTPHSMLH